MADKVTKESVIAKLEQKQSLSREEEFFYLTQVLSHSDQDARNIMAIVDKTTSTLIID